MSMENKHIFKNVLKSQYLFEQRYWTKEKCVESLGHLFERYNPNGLEGLDIKAPLRSSNEQEAVDSFQESRKRFAQSLQTINEWDTPKRNIFLNEIDKLLDVWDLGKEWRLPMITIVLQSWFFPPLHNLSIERVGKRISLELNSDTSVDDIKAAWEEIDRKKVKLWPDFPKRKNLTKKSFGYLSIAVRDRIEHVLPEEKWDLERVVSTETSKPLSRDRDIERVGEYWPNEEDISKEADKKRAQNLRKIRERAGIMKEKT